jgi:outer membrane protein TolC
MVGLIASGVAAPANGQALLTIGEALQRADHGAYANRAAVGQATARAGQAMAALQGVLPEVRVVGAFTRTTDPLAAFGFRLQQRGVTPASFDPAALNSPNAIGNVGAGLVLEQPIVNADAWLGRRAATRAHEAAVAAESWTRASTALETVRAYFSALLATERIDALQAAVAAAHAHLRQAEALFNQGVVTRSDALLASVRTEQLESDLVAARGDAETARLELAVVLGTPGDTLWKLPALLPAAERIRSLAQRAATGTAPSRERSDVLAAALDRAAADANLDRARARFIPRINSFGRLDWNAPTSPFGGRDSWTVGVAVSWAPFGGVSEWSDVMTASGQRASAAVGAAGAAAAAQLELQRSDISLATSLDRLATAERALGESAEAHRIVSRKYDGGLATLVELLDAAAAETQSQVGFAEARYQAIVAAVTRRRAAGQDLSVIEDLTP